MRSPFLSAISCLLAPAILAAGVAAQDVAGFFGRSADQETPVDGSEFVFARLRYGGGAFGSRWNTDYDAADVKFMLGIERLSNARIDLDARVTVAPLDPELFDYPLVYAVEVGSWYFNDEEAARMREYMERGGFLVVDDFWGTLQWDDFSRQLAKVFPDREVEPIPLSHAVFHSFYDIDEIIQVPSIRICRGSSQTWQGDGYTPYVLGVFDDDRRLMMAINFNTDLGDAWEWADDPCYPHFYSGFAYRMGINFIVYAMTH